MGVWGGLTPPYATSVADPPWADIGKRLTGVSGDRVDFAAAEMAADYGNRLCAAMPKLVITAGVDGLVLVDAEALTTNRHQLTGWLLVPEEDGTYTAMGSGVTCSLAEHLVNITGCYVGHGGKLR